MADEKQIAVTVTANEMYQELRSMRDLLTEMAVKLDVVPDHERRIRFLERAVWVSMVAASAIGTFAKDAISVL